MNINKPTDAVAPQSALRPTGATSRPAAGGSGGGKVEGVQSPDSVTLSDTGRSLAAAGQAVDQFRQDKVAEIKRQLELGTYRIQAKVVADRMISQAADLLRAMATH
jgi:flagellar biosynthesis anti-sigma factor FlgM